MDMYGFQNQYDCLHQCNYGNAKIDTVDPLLKSNVMLNGYVLIDRIFQNFPNYDEILDSHGIVLLDKDNFYNQIESFFSKISEFDIIHLKVLLKIFEDDKVRISIKILESMFGLNVIFQDNKVEIQLSRN